MSLELTANSKVLDGSESKQPLASIPFASSDRIVATLAIDPRAVATSASSRAFSPPPSVDLTVVRTPQLKPLPPPLDLTFDISLTLFGDARGPQRQGALVGAVEGGEGSIARLSPNVVRLTFDRAAVVAVPGRYFLRFGVPFASPSELSTSIMTVTTRASSVRALTPPPLVVRAGQTFAVSIAVAAAGGASVPRALTCAAVVDTSPSAPQIARACALTGADGVANLAVAFTSGRSGAALLRFSAGVASSDGWGPVEVLADVASIAVMRNLVPMEGGGLVPLGGLLDADLLSAPAVFAAGAISAEGEAPIANVRLPVVRVRDEFGNGVPFRKVGLEIANRSSVVNISFEILYRAGDYEFTKLAVLRAPPTGFYTPVVSVDGELLQLPAVFFRNPSQPDLFSVLSIRRFLILGILVAIPLFASNLARRTSLLLFLSFGATIAYAVVAGLYTNGTAFAS